MNDIAELLDQMNERYDAEIRSGGDSLVLSK